MANKSSTQRIGSLHGITASRCSADGIAPDPWSTALLVEAKSTVPDTFFEVVNVFKVVARNKKNIVILYVRTI